MNDNRRAWHVRSRDVFDEQKLLSVLGACVIDN